MEKDWRPSVESLQRQNEQLRAQLDGQQSTLDRLVRSHNGLLSELEHLRRWKQSLLQLVNAQQTDIEDLRSRSSPTRTITSSSLLLLEENKEEEEKGHPKKKRKRTTTTATAATKRARHSSETEPTLASVSGVQGGDDGRTKRSYKAPTIRQPQQQKQQDKPSRTDPAKSMKLLPAIDRELPPLPPPTTTKRNGSNAATMPDHAMVREEDMECEYLPDHFPDGGESAHEEERGPEEAAVAMVVQTLLRSSNGAAKSVTDREQRLAKICKSLRSFEALAECCRLVWTAMTTSERIVGATGSGFGSSVQHSPLFPEKSIQCDCPLPAEELDFILLVMTVCKCNQLSLSSLLADIAHLLISKSDEESPSLPFLCRGCRALVTMAMNDEAESTQELVCIFVFDLLRECRQGGKATFLLLENATNVRRDLLLLGTPEEAGDSSFVLRAVERVLTSLYVEQRASSSADRGSDDASICLECYPIIAERSGWMVPTTDMAQTTSREEILSAYAQQLVEALRERLSGDPSTDMEDLLAPGELVDARTFDLVKAMELVAFYQGWEWSYNDLVVNRLHPMLQENASKDVALVAIVYIFGWIARLGMVPSQLEHAKTLLKGMTRLIDGVEEDEDAGYPQVRQAAAALGIAVACCVAPQREIAAFQSSQLRQVVSWVRRTEAAHRTAVFDRLPLFLTSF